MKPIILSIVSKGRESGKTSLIERLIERFTDDGIKVATVKHIHSSFDTPEKDTWRHLDAGATMTIASSPTEVITIRKSANPSLEEVLEALYIKTDLVLVEGYKQSLIPKILIAENMIDVQDIIKETPNIIMISGAVVNKVEEKKKLKVQFPEIKLYDFKELIQAIKEMLRIEILRTLPNLNCGDCGYTTCLELAEAVLRGGATIDDCKRSFINLATLKVNGRSIQLGKFPQEVLKGVVLGLLSSLKDVTEHPKNIEIIILG